MKRGLFVLCLLLIIPYVLTAQQRISAEEIMKDVERGEAIRYEGVEIFGDLDFTKISDVTRDRDRDSNRGRIKIGRSTIVLSDDQSRHRHGSSRTYWCHVQSPLSFKNCIFTGGVIAYVHDDWEKSTYNAVFHEDVEFRGCEFRKESAFKYARFRKDACFEQSTFEDEALFKYTRFSSEISFTGSVFYGVANFKYTDFPEYVRFDNALFRREGDFKYTEFPRGVTFSNAVFQRDANFKYTELDEPVDFDGVEFENDTDFRYAKIDGRRFTSYLLTRKR